MKSVLFKPSLIICALLLAQMVVISAVTYDFSSVTAELKKHLALFDGRISYIVQKKDGTVLVKEHLADSSHTAYTDESTIHIASGCKWPAMATIMKLVENGQLFMDQKISDFYKNGEFTGDAATAQIWQLMTHTSGFEYFDEWCSSTDISLQASAIGIGKGGTIDGAPVAKSILKNKPGTTVLYGDIGMQVIGAIAEQVSKKSFNDMWKEYIANPLGMVNAIFTAFDGEVGINIAIADGLLIRMQDYANFMLMLMNGGTFNGKQVLKPETVAAILKDYTSNIDVDPTNDKYTTDGKLPFGLGTWIFDNGNEFSSNGVHRFYDYFDVKNQFLTIFYVRTTLDTNDETDAIFDALKLKIKAIVTGQFSDEIVTGYQLQACMFLLILLNSLVLLL